MDWVVRFISEVRSVRAEMNVPAGARVKLNIKGANGESLARFERHRDLVMRLARLETADVSDVVPQGAVQIVLDEATLVLPLSGLIDVAAETARLTKEIGKLEGEVAKIDAKLGNARFVAGAPEEVVEEQRERRAEAEAALVKLREALKRVEAVV